MYNYVYNNPNSMYISVMFRDTIINVCFTNPTNNRRGLIIGLKACCPIHC